MAEALSRKDVKDWLIETVAPEIREIIENGEFVHAQHVSEENAARLKWFASNFVPADPDELHYPDGSNDGGMDVVMVEEADDLTCFTVYQFSSADLDGLEEGKMPPATSKLNDDILLFRNVVLGKTKSGKTDLNPSAREAINRLHKALERSALDGSTHETLIRVAPATLKRMDEANAAVLASTRRAAEEKWSLEKPRVRWVIDDPLTAERLLEEYLKTPTRALPEEIQIRLTATPSIAHNLKGPVLCFARVADILEHYDKYRSALFDSNLRYYLNRKTVVHEKIIQAVQSQRGIRWFHVYNNGVVLACGRFTVVKSDPPAIRLLRPQFINGCQTIVALANERSRLLRSGTERAPKERELLGAIDGEMVLPMKVVVEANSSDVDTIAIASNTQTPLSDRTLRSSSNEGRQLKRVIAHGTRPWFLETKDGEWKSLVGEKRSLMQSVTGNKTEKDFKLTVGRDGVRRMDNEDLGVALLSFYGFCSEAKPSRVFKSEFFHRLFAHRPIDTKWSLLAAAPPLWRDPSVEAIFEDNHPGAHLAALVYMVWSFWKFWTLSDRQQQLLAFEEHARKDSAFEKYRDGSKWNVPDDTWQELRADPESIYWVERCLKGAYLALPYQSMRLLVRRYGNLTDATCMSILGKPEFLELYDGHPCSSLSDFRDGSLLDGPVSAIALIVRQSARSLVRLHESEFRGILSPQQTLLDPKWIRRLSDQVDATVGRLGNIGWATDMGLTKSTSRPSLTLGDVLP